MYKVQKRDDKVVDFDLSKISAAIAKAFEASNTQYNKDIIELLALKVTADFEKKIVDDKVRVYFPLNIEDGRLFYDAKDDVKEEYSETVNYFYPK